MKLRIGTWACECGHAEAEHDGLGKCKSDGCGCTFPHPTSKKLRLADLPVHESGLRLMDREHPAVAMQEIHRVPLPPCCPVSGNPLAGSILTVSYTPVAHVLEVYSLRTLVGKFKGGFPGVGKYPAERNMEGMIQLLAQMCADALQVKVDARADLNIDAGNMEIICAAEPQ